MKKTKQTPETLGTNLEDLQELLKNPEFGLAHSLQTRSAIVMFEFILRKMKDLNDKIEEIDRRGKIND